MTTRFVVSNDGARIAYDVTGTGPVLMLLHGAGKTRKDWHRAGYVKRLARDWTTIAVDMRGTGESEFLTHGGDYAIDKICADVLAVADTCGIDQFAVWGYSFGGNIGRYLAARSERVRALVVVGVPFGPAVDEEFDRYIDQFVAKYGPLAQAYNDGALPPAQHKAAIKGSIPVWIACFQAMRDWPPVPPADVRCPALLIAGTRNTNTMSWIERNRETLAAARVKVEIVEGLTHLQEFSDVEQVEPLGSAFLREATDQVLTNAMEDSDG
jgi:pimeloyl-ACP methyl ester carboxylesterase